MHGPFSVVEEASLCARAVTFPVAIPFKRRRRWRGARNSLNRHFAGSKITRTPAAGRLSSTAGFTASPGCLVIELGAVSRGVALAAPKYRPRPDRSTWAAAAGTPYLPGLYRAHAGTRNRWPGPKSTVTQLTLFDQTTTTTNTRSTPLVDLTSSWRKAILFFKLGALAARYPSGYPKAAE